MFWNVMSNVGMSLKVKTQTVCCRHHIVDVMQIDILTLRYSSEYKLALKWKRNFEIRISNAGQTSICNLPTWKYDQRKTECHWQYKSNFDYITCQRWTEVQKNIPRKWFHTKGHISKEAHQNVNESANCRSWLDVIVHFIQWNVGHIFEYLEKLPVDEMITMF